MIWPSASIKKRSGISLPSVAVCSVTIVPPPAPVPDATISQIVNLEIEYRTASASDHERQKDFLRRSIEQADKQALVLSEQKQNEAEGVQADAQDLQKARAAYGNGSLPSPRVAEVLAGRDRQ